MIALSHVAGLVQGTRVVECPPAGDMYRLPLTVSTPARAAEMKLAESKFKAFVQRRRRMQALEYEKHT